MTDHPLDCQTALERARPRLGRLATSIVCLPTVGSTNDAAAAIGTEGAVVVADEQTAGRGRRGRTWFSPPGSGLYVSVVLMPGKAGDRATTLLTLAAGVAIAEGIDASIAGGSERPALHVDLKWPNDLYVARRKLGGILAEADGTRVVLGYGINVAPSAYPPDVAARATSLESELGRPIDRHHVLAETLAALASRYEDLLAARFDAILDAWRARAPSANGARVSWTTPSGAQSGVTCGVDDRGALLVRTDNGIERIVSGEVTWF